MESTMKCFDSRSDLASGVLSDFWLPTENRFTNWPKQCEWNVGTEQVQVVGKACAENVGSPFYAETAGRIEENISVYRY